MLRKSILAGVGTLTAIVALMGTADSARAWFDDPYVPGCRSGYCGGGDFYVGGWCRGCCAQRGSRCRNRYYSTQGTGTYGSGMGYSPRTYQTTAPPTPSLPSPAQSDTLR